MLEFLSQKIKGLCYVDNNLLLKQSCYL